ncbi:hypothetical protein PILCRDRAFT_817209 [Piloderma croceum F 1598]|uniref:Co-chaperone HscB C-terminal oligomerisation domain-containing protein n=1 Tax=Piloderma croceum (strain F 1598) TaxID=765440 RepID=A0A0C3FMB6_PILCF|nr:hypothetical protein PILCRDRAFT_817209 [Piloderma croceum F 1598]
MARLAFSRLCFPRYHNTFNPAPSLRISFSTSRLAQNSLQQPRRCPKCSIILPTALPACPNCHYISQLDNIPSYHKLFQLPFEPNPFVVDTSKLKRRYLEAQKICHPDTWATHGTESHKIAEGLSHHIGSAWTTLKDPLPRAEYILKLQGIEIAEEDQLEDLEFISEIMQVREELENATPSEVPKIADKNHDEILKMCKDIEKFVGERDWEKAKAATIRLKYLDGIKRAANEWRPDLRQ